jgi:thymidylate synthase ThyX
MDLAFETYARWIPAVEEHFRVKHPKAPEDSDQVYRSVIRAKALDTLRGLLPASTTSNVGLFGTGQAYEALLLRMFAHPLAEVRACASRILTELRQVMPAFLTRVDQKDRGGRWTEYLADTRRAVENAARPIVDDVPPEPRAEVTLTDFDPDGETKVVAAALYAVSALPDDQLTALARTLAPDVRAAVLRAYVGERANRRHKPGRAFERTHYRFDVLTDYGAFRDLQRHRLLTLEWQPLSTRHGYTEPSAIEEAGALADWRAVVDGSADLYEKLLSAGLRDVAPYAVVMAYRVRFYMEMNAREAMHVIELRTAPQGHPSYRRVCQMMHQAIKDVAGHHAIADAMQFADHSEVELERLQSERALERKRSQSRAGKARGYRGLVSFISASCGNPESACRPDTLGKPLDPFVDLGRRESAERQPEEALATTLGKERQAIGQIQAPLRRLLAHRGGRHALRQREGEEEPAVRPRRRRIGHVAVEGGQARVEPRRVELLE